MSKNVVIAGASGFIGSALQAELKNHGWNITTLSRGSSRGQYWDPETFTIDPQILAGQDAVISLNGAPLAKWPWTHEYKHLIVDSRLKAVKTLADAINLLPEDERPKVFLTGSAVGYYGSRGNEVLEEDSSPANDFLAGLCQVWEREASKANVERVVNIRTGIVIHESGGILASLKPLFKTMLGGKLSDGRQWMPTISLRDHVAASRFLLESNLEGPFNLTGPEPCTNDEFTEATAAYFGRIPGIPAPAGVLRVLAGDMSVLALSSQYAVPKRLLDAGFTFADPDIYRQLDSAGTRI
ncbi:MAG: TIGR01777 family oxidoreductase [Actinomycetaceae bacterium]|nr:TIGR01777 family oxidoreductase [Actinomycetaceae bacterium]